MAQRISSHLIETQSRNWLRTILDSNGGLVREITERDYGIDLLVEIFNDGFITGKIAFIQVKGTNNQIEHLKNSKEVSCIISTANARYAFQDKIPFFLMYVSLAKPEICYWELLQDRLQKEVEQKIAKQNSLTIRIPVNQSFSDNPSNFLNKIDLFYKVK